MPMLESSRVLMIVEDNEDVRHLAAGLFSLSGYRVLEAPGADACLRMASSNRPDAVLLDFDLPEGPGLDVLERLRTDSTQPPAVIVMSADDDPAVRHRVMELGATAFLPKPWTAEELESTVAAALN
jgi:DNA-binding response OmpR family regulator